jgi:Tol biopolymer transport system component
MGCSPQNQLIGKWTFRDSGSLYSNKCPLYLEFLGDGTSKAGSASGKYKDMGNGNIMFDFAPVWKVSLQTGYVYEYIITNGVLSISAQNFYCEYTNPLNVSKTTEKPSPVVTLQRSTEQTDLLASVRGKGKIIFESTRNQLWHLYSMNPDGSDLRPLTKAGVIGHSPDCSPDGKRIVANDIGGQIFTINIDGTNQTPILTSGKSISPRWSPDGKQIVYVSGEGSNQIYIMNADGSGQTQLTSTGEDNIIPVWTIEGQIAFYAQAEKKYYRMNSDGSEIKEIIKDEFDSYEREWSPDKSAYVAVTQGTNDITLFSADSSVSARLMEDKPGDFNPTWCP